MVSITEKEFKQLTQYIRSNYGINLKEEKKALVIGRLQNVLLENRIDSFAQYFDYVLADKTGNATITLLNKITTNHTFFMREADHFHYLKENVLPFLSANVKDKDLRIWSAGCSTGEEPYTLAMIIDEFFGREKMLWDAKILATDISNKVIDTAVNGVYSNDKIACLPPQWRLNYFKKVDSFNSVVTDRMKNEIFFRKFNLMETTFPFKKKFHVIFCRNVMIYFDSKTKNELINKFYDMTEYGGYLFIGHSESINREETRYKYIKPAIYRKE